jgi:hypothetical protein
MGISGFDKLINQLEVPSTKRSFNQFVQENKGQTISVDMLANFYQWLLHSELEFLKRQFVEWFGGEGKEHIELVFDGERTIQKLDTAVKRASKNQKESESLLEKANALQQREEGARIRAQIKR